MDKSEFAGKRVLVTGAGTGIGRGVALEFAKLGSHVVLHYFRERAGASTAVAEIVGMGGRARAIRADLKTIPAITRLAAKAIRFLGGLDVLVNNAGITFNQPFSEVTPEQFDTLYAVNVRAQFFLIQKCLNALSESGSGSVINISSVHAFAGMTEHSVYAGTKGAIASYTRALALELSQKNVRANVIAPGWIFVENHRTVLGQDFDTAAAGKALPAGFIGAPPDIGQLAVFLASKASRYIIGQTIVCDGGQVALMALTGDFRDRLAQRWGRDYV